MVLPKELQPPPPLHPAITRQQNLITTEGCSMLRVHIRGLPCGQHKQLPLTVLQTACTSRLPGSRLTLALTCAAVLPGQQHGDDSASAWCLSQGRPPRGGSLPDVHCKPAAAYQAGSTPGRQATGNAACHVSNAEDSGQRTRQKCSMTLYISSGLRVEPKGNSSATMMSVSTLEWMTWLSWFRLTVPLIPIRQCSCRWWEMSQH